MNNVIELPTAHREPIIETRFTLVDEGITRTIDPRDREMWQAAVIEPSDDETDQFVALPIRVGLRYGEPAIELGKYALNLDDARELIGHLTRFCDQFREVSA